MTRYWLHLTLLSNTAFGRGSGIPGLIDQDVALDKHGCPYLHGRTLKGLLNEACAEILYALDPKERTPHLWIEAADALFGRPGSGQHTQGKLRIGHARLPQDLQRVIQGRIEQKAWSTDAVTDALTTLRSQTAMGPDGAPDPHTLRTVRLILRGTPFVAEVVTSDDLSPKEKGLLAACILGFRRAGSARNRGRGLLRAQLSLSQDAPYEDGQDDLADAWYNENFKAEVCP